MSWVSKTKSLPTEEVAPEEPAPKLNASRDALKTSLNSSSDPASVLARKEGHGRVKCVLSGDSVVIWVTGAGATPVEKQITLSLLSAPRIARGKDAGQDQPFAWESREFLRHLLISRDVSYRIDFTHPTSGRQYGWVRAKDGTQINLAVAKAGWARVQEPRGGKGPRGKDHEELLAAGDAAEAQGLGIYTREAGAAANSVREVTEHFDSRDFFEKMRDQQPLKGVVEGVLDGSTVRVLLVPSFYSIVCRLSGVQCPLWKREDSNAHSKAHAEPTLRVAQPLAPQAKYVTEYCLLNRDVVATLAGVNKDDTYYGTVLYKGKNVAEELLKQGLAKYVPWSASEAEKARFRQLEATSKSQGVGMWKNAVRSKLTGSDFYGIVREVRTGSRITVEDEEGKVYDAFFSSVIAPKLNPRSPKEDEKLGFESKEYLRKKIIGKRVHMMFDYDKPAQASKVAGDPDAPPRFFFSVYLGKKHLPLSMVEQGLASVITHRREEARSREYSLLLEAEVKAKEAQRGVWAPSAEIKRVNDMSSIKAAQAKQYIKFLTKKGLQAVVEFMLNPVRLKLYVPSLNSYISFTVAGVRAPWFNPSKSSNDFYGEESITFARNYLHQRKVDIEVYTSDKGGNFIGALSIKHPSDKVDYAGVLLEAGAASLSEQADRYPRYEAMKNAQHLAQQHRRGIWQHWKAEESTSKAEAPPQPEMASLLVTHIEDANTFYCQHVSDADRDTLSRMMEILQQTKGGEATGDWKRNQLCAARYEHDGMWYRVRLLQQEGQRLWRVHYVDFGNSEVIGTSQLQPLVDPRVAGVPVQAKLCHLSLIKVPTLEEEHGPQAAQLLKDLSWGKVLIASIDSKDPGTGAYYITLGDAETKVNINKRLVRSGLALVRQNQAGGYYDMPIQQLLAEQEIARANRSNWWQYGDLDLEDILEEDALK